MKNNIKTIVLALFALVATAAFAGDAAASKLTLHLTDTATIAGTKLAPGDYNVYVTREGDDAKVRVTDGPKELVTTTAKYRPMSQFAGGVALAKTSSNEVVELQSRKLKGALVFSASEGAASSQGSSK